MFKLFGNKKELKEENKKLKEQLKECGEKLIEKQEHINKTNAYYKKKMREQKITKS
jgi:peptidoglycan hydrolase CwlO-like protein